jgi:hypothetical protein
VGVIVTKVRIIKDVMGFTASSFPVAAGAQHHKSAQMVFPESGLDFGPKSPGTA